MLSVHGFSKTNSIFPATKHKIEKKAIESKKEIPTLGSACKGVTCKLVMVIFYSKELIFRRFLSNNKGKLNAGEMRTKPVLNIHFTPIWGKFLIRREMKSFS
jgi:hypothetical protein